MQSEPKTTAACPRCGAAFRCGAADGACWCMDLPRIAMPDGPAACLCPDCLKAEIARQDIGR